jgi:hypothetical protein
VINVRGNISNNTISADQSVCVNTQPALIRGSVASGGDGTAVYQWQISADNFGWTNIPGATGLDYAPPVLTRTSFFRRVAATVLCGGAQANASNPVTITLREDARALFTARH